MFAKSRADISAKPVRVMCDMGGFSLVAGEGWLKCERANFSHALAPDAKKDF